MNSKFFLIATIAKITVASTYGGPRTSANYSIATDSADSGGRRGMSASYTNEGSAGLVAGISTVASPSETAKSGYIGQLYEVTGLLVTASPATVSELANLPLAASQLLDDASLLALNASTVAWGVVSGPITSISTAGLATAGTVPQNTAATVQGTFGGFSGSLSLTVFDTIADNFGSYAGDSIADDWQVQYFGQPPNANAGPTMDLSGTGQTNLFKYIAGLNPLNPNSRFTLSIAPVAGQPGQKAIVFTPRLTDRTYTVTFKTDLGAAGWTPVAGATFTDAGLQRTVTDPAAGAQKFYHVEITKP